MRESWRLNARIHMCFHPLLTYFLPAQCAAALLDFFRQEQPLSVTQSFFLVAVQACCLFPVATASLRFFRDLARVVFFNERRSFWLILRLAMSVFFFIQA